MSVSRKKKSVAKFVFIDTSVSDFFVHRDKIRYRFNKIQREIQSNKRTKLLLSTFIESGTESAFTPLQENRKTGF